MINMADDIEISEKSIVVLAIVAIVGWYIITNPLVSGVVLILALLVFVLFMMVFFTRQVARAMKSVGKTLESIFDMD